MPFIIALIVRSDRREGGTGSANGLNKSLFHNAIFCYAKTCNVGWGNRGQID